ncbi:MAG TPA: penicillin acylase family protein [Bryobacteraceae bacterium]|nr:penicillin acylase family protein [Bryobacteraceae bacterium]
MTQPVVARVVKAVNLAILVVLAAVIAGVYWFVWRPLPQRAGVIEAAVSAPVHVEFDALGVPHIHASSLEDALIVQGYVTAQDRLWQMDGLRRYSGGNLAEILGPDAIESDRESRRLRLRRIAEEAYTRLPAGDRAALAAYALGVNQFIDAHRNNLPIEFTLLGYQPKPWSAVDSLLIGLYMFRDLTTTWRDELIKRTMRANGDPQKVDFLFSERIGNEPSPGSNAWVLAGSRTASGKPLLSNDPHLEYSMPGIWYMAHLQAPGLDVSGVTVPGLPGVTLGHNQCIAWGATNLQFDVQDLYVEKFDDRTGRYLYRGQIEQARAEREIVQVKGRKPVELAAWVTRHGPIFVADENERLALRWTAAEPGLLQYPVLEINRAQNWQQFTAALARWGGPGQNFVYADTDGNIGYHAAGMLPKRRGYAGDLPVDGSSGDFDWDGFIPFDQLPSAFNPPGGIIATANQNPFPPDYPYPVNGNFAPPYRARQIHDLLTARRGWRAEDMLTVQKDVYSAFSKFLATQVVAACDRRNVRNPGLDTAIDLLRSWNGQMDKDLAAPFLIELVYQHVRSSVADVAAPGKGQLYDYKMGAALVEKLLRERPETWFRDYDAMLLRALTDAIDEGRRMQGANLSRWKYGAYLRIEIDHPVIHAALGRIPVIGRHLDFFEIGPVPMSGSATTIKQTTRGLSPSMRMNADLADWDHSLLNIQIGQAGQPLSSHYADQWSDYYNARSYAMQYRTVKAKSTLEFQPRNGI